MISSEKSPFAITPALLSAVAGALVMWWGLSDRMEKAVTEKVNLLSRVAQLGERVEGLRSEIQNLRDRINTQPTTTISKP